MAGQDEMKEQANVVLHGLWRNLPAILAILTVGLYVNNSILIGQAKTDALSESVKGMQTVVENMSLIQHRVSRVEEAVAAMNVRVDGISNTLINDINALRRDLSRATTTLEVVLTKVEIISGEEPYERPKRRARPAGPIQAD